MANPNQSQQVKNAARRPDGTFLPKKETRGVNVFFPGAAHDKQAEVRADPSEYKLLRCGRKWGKTQLLVSSQMGRAIKNECSLFEAIKAGEVTDREVLRTHGEGCPSNLTFPYIAPSFKQGKNIIWRDHVAKLLRHFDEIGLLYKKNESELSITFPSGGRFQIFGVENEEGLRGVSNWGHVVADEYDDWGEDVITFIVLPNLTPHRAGLTVAGTPKGFAGMHGLEQAEDEEGNRLFKAWHFTSYENPVIPKVDIDKLARWAKTKGDDFFQQEIMAEYIKPYGVVYKEFSRINQVTSKVKYNPALPLHLAMDFGVKDPTALIWLQPTPDGFLNVIDYHEESNSDVDYFASLIKSKPYKALSLAVPDPSGIARSATTATSIVGEYRDRGIPFPADENVIKPPDIKTQVLSTHQVIPRLRIQSPTKVRKFNDPAHRGTQRFIDVLTNYRYPEEVSDRRQREVDPVHDQWSHGARAFEYYCYAAAGILTPGQEKHDKPMRLKTGVTKEGFYGAR